MSFQRPAEKILAPDNRSPDRIIADAIAHQENTCRQQIEKLRAEYQSLAVTVHKIDPRYKVESFPAGDTTQMQLLDLKAIVASAKELVVSLKDLVPQLREQQEAKRKAGLSPIEALEERVKDLERGRVADRAEIAALRAQFAARFDSETSSPSLQRKPSSVPPMLMATARRGGGTVSAFFGDDPHVPPGDNGVRRLGKSPS
jgi:hypothetical protein